MTCTTHHTGCECRERKWRIVARRLRTMAFAVAVLVGREDVDAWVESVMRRAGLVRRDGKWEFIDVP